MRRYPAAWAGLMLLLILLPLLWIWQTSNQASPLSLATWERTEPPDSLGLLPIEKRSPTNPDAAAALRFNQTYDPATGTVPRDRLWAANRMAEEFKPNNTQLYPFSERGPSTIGGRTRAILWDPDVTDKVWAGSVSGGLWYTSDITVDGTTWISVDDFWDNLALTTMAADPTTSGGSRVFYVGTGEGFFNVDAVRGAGIFKSTDGGTSFSLLASTDNNASFHYVQKVVVTSTGTVLAATRDGLQRSTNGGSSWTKVLGIGVGSPSTSLTNFAADLEIAANGDIYAGMGLVFSGSCDGVYKSTNDGANWTKQTLPGACDFRRVELATAPSDANTVYVATQSASTNAVNHIFKTTNGGTSWSSPGAAPAAGSQAWYDLILSVDPNNDDRVYLGVVTLWRTTNGGTSWSLMDGGANIHVDHHAIAYRPGSSTEIAFGNDGGVYYTSTGTSKNAFVPTFVNRNDNYNVTQYYGGDMHPTLTNVMLAGSQDNSTQRFSSAGIGPVTSPSPLNCCDGGFAYFDQTNGNIAIGSIQNGIYFQSTNAGASFSGSPFLNAGGLFINPGDYDDVENAFYAARSASAVSACFTMEGTPTCGFFTVTGMSNIASTFTTSPYSPANTSTVFFGTQQGELFRMDVPLSGGVPSGSATICEFPTGSRPTGPGANISSIAIGSTESQLLVTYSNFGLNSVWESLNATSNCVGTTWNDRDDNLTLPDIPVNWALYDPSNTLRVLLATDAGLWGTENVTATALPGNASKAQAAPLWFRDPTVPIVRIDQLVRRASDGLIMVVTHGRGVWTGQFPPLLPVELTTFDATIDGDAVMLAWETASETNNAGFEIEYRYYDGDFERLDWVEGQGTTETPQQYQYRAGNLEPGRYTFRLKQIDFDGTFEYHPEVEAFVELPEAYVLSEAYPNPFNTETQFTLMLAAPQNVMVSIYDIAGRQVALLHDGPLGANIPHRFTFSGAGLPSGLYFYQAVGERFRDAGSLTLVK